MPVAELKPKNGRLLKLLNEKLVPKSRDLRALLYDKAGFGHLNDRQIKVLKVAGANPEGISVSKLTQECADRLKKSGLDDSAGVSTVANAVNTLCWELHYLEKIKMPPPNPQKPTYVKLTDEGKNIYEKICTADKYRASIVEDAAGADVELIIKFYERLIKKIDAELSRDITSTD